MKRTVLPLLTLTLVLLAGCVVTAVYPYYTAKDLTFEPALLGVWRDPEAAPDTGNTWTFEKLAAQTYKLTVREGNRTNEFDAHLFTLGNQKFLDCLERERGPYSMPVHVLLHLQTLQPQLESRLLDYEWLAKQLEANPKLIAHARVPGPIADGAATETRITLNADTAHLQQFIRQQLKNTNAWAPPMVMRKS